MNMACRKRERDFWSRDVIPVVVTRPNPPFLNFVEGFASLGFFTNYKRIKLNFSVLALPWS